MPYEVKIRSKRNVIQLNGRLNFSCVYVCVFFFFGGGILRASAGDIRDEGSIPGFGMISPGVGNGTPPQYSYLENSMDRGAWQATVHRSCKESDTTEVI